MISLPKERRYKYMKRYLIKKNQDLVFHIGNCRSNFWFFLLHLESPIRAYFLSCSAWAPSGGSRNFCWVGKLYIYSLLSKNGAQLYLDTEEYERIFVIDTFVSRKG
jgi:hypothetical protein